MSLLTPKPPADHYVWLGRVMSACSMLEVQVGMIGWAWKNRKPWTENWSEVAGSPGAAWRLCEDALPEMDSILASEVSKLLEDAVMVRAERNKFAHAVFTLDPSRPAGDQWILKSARNAEFRPLTEHHGAKLVATANQLSKRAEVLRKRAAAAAIRPVRQQR